MYDFEGHFPGSSPLIIECWDYDMVFGDELIGTSVLDLEDRYFSIDWTALEAKPIEYRQLYHPSSAMSQGVVKCWLEINPCSADPGSVTTWDIKPKDPYDLEIRICVLNAKEIPMDDSGTCDCYFRGFFDTKEDVQETDTHFRNQDGKPDFQYRMIFDVKHPKKITKFTIQAFDRDFFKSNEMLGEATVDLKQIMEDVSLIKGPLPINKKYFEEVLKPDSPTLAMNFDKEDDSKLWLQMMTKKDGKITKSG